MLTSAQAMKTIADSALGRRILAEAATEQLATRRTVIAERERIKEEGARRAAAAARTTAEAKAAREQAEATLKAAQLREMEATHAWLNLSSSTERGIERCNRVLEATADPAIDELINWLESKFRKACSEPNPALLVPPSLAAVMLGKAAPPPKPRNEQPATLTIRAAIDAARALKHEALDDAELRRRLDEIIGTVPSEYSAGAP